MNARIRALTTNKTRLEAHARGVVLNCVAAVDAQIQDSIDRLKVYPPPKPDSRYIRTHRLEEAWMAGPTSVTNSGIRGTILNNMGYAMLVHGDEQGVGQQQQHKLTGWPLMAEVLREGFKDRIKKARRDA